MDPDETRKKMVELANTLLVELDREERDFDQIIVLGTELAETVDGLDEWLCSGGFFPAVWTPPNTHRANDGRHKDAWVFASNLLETRKQHDQR